MFIAGLSAAKGRVRAKQQPPNDKSQSASPFSLWNVSDQSSGAA